MRRNLWQWLSPIRCGQSAGRRLHYSFALLFFAAALVGGFARRKALGVASALLLALVLTAAGCGGGGGSSTPPPVTIPGTPAGTYNISVTATTISSARAGSVRNQFHGVPRAGRGIRIDEVESEIEGDIDLRGFLGIDESVPKGYQGIRMTFRIKADVPDEQLQEVCQLGVKYSPVFNTLAKGIPINVKPERG